MCASKVLIAAILLASSALAGFDIGYRDDSDLTHFVTRPDIKAPILDVKFHDRDNVLPGKWFIAPYADITQQRHPRNYYQACQTGPNIYDLDGTLIWSGACDVRNQNTCDFRAFSFNGTDYLTGIMHRYLDDTKGHGVIWDNSYRPIHRIIAPVTTTVFNMHELKVFPSEKGLSALHLTIRAQQVDVRDLQVGFDEGWISDSGFVEVDVFTGEKLFEWYPADHISLTESTVTLDRDRLRKPPPATWSWFHANSIDKNKDGDYLMSSRWTNTIYKISGTDSGIEWKLGGKNSDFLLQDFNFSRQHDAQWVSYDDDKEIISFLDNGADPENQTSSTSSALIVELDKQSEPPVARVLSRIWRPDGGLSRLRGNFQRFSHSTNVIAGWSDNAYISEHDKDGKLLLETRFRSERFVTYRAYKMNFTGAPLDPPVLKAYTFGESLDSCVTVVYVSWNGATEVTQWDFYEDGDSPRFLGSKIKSGFETVFQKAGCYSPIFAEALDKEKKILGRSNVFNVAISSDWDAAGNGRLTDQNPHEKGPSLRVLHEAGNEKSEL